MRILVTGGTGLIGSKIIEFCLENNIEVNYLTRHSSKIKNVENLRGFLWNPKENQIDLGCLQDVKAIINLAGANLFSRWTKSYKKILYESRIKSLEFLLQILKENQNEVEQLVSASAIGVYPSSFQKIYRENEINKPDSFLEELVWDWEIAADKFSGIGMDVAKIRTGVVLAEKGGALPLFKLSVKNYMGAPLANGRQWQSWIHIDDITRIYLFAIFKNLDGIYNGVAPNPVTNQELTIAIAQHLNKPLWLPKIPKTVLQLFLGEMGEIAWSSQLVESKKIEKMGFRFRYTNINKALEDLL